MLDTRMLLGAQGVQAPDMVQSAQQAMSLAALADAQRLRQMAMRDRERADQESDALRKSLPGLQQGGYSDEAILAAIQQNPQAGPAILTEAAKQRKARADEAKDRADTDSKNWKRQQEQYVFTGGIAGGLAQNPTRENWLAARANLQRVGVDPSVLDVPDGMDPQQHFTNIATGSMDRAKQLELQGQQQTRDQTRIRDQNTQDNYLRVDSRQREANTAQNEIARARLAQAAAAQAQARATTQAGVDKNTRDTEMKLADDYRTQSKGFQEVSGSIRKINAALSTATTNAGSALAAGTAFMKLLDPGSVVRESELGMALNASGWFDRATNIAQVLRSGKVMTPEQVKNLRAASEALFAEAAATQRQIDSAYSKRAKDYGANPDRIITDFGQVQRGGAFKVQLPDGQVASFPSESAALEFKTKAGIK